MQGKRPKGRPHNTWFTDIKKWTGLKGGECARMAADRNLWRCLLASILFEKMTPLGNLDNVYF